MKTLLIADTHFNFGEIDTYCDRPENYSDLIVRGWKAVVRPEDTVIHLGDVGIGKWGMWDEILKALPGRKILIRGNHDWHHPCSWWMDHGFDFACDGMSFRKAWLSHHPEPHRMPKGCQVNIHGHLHNVWHGFKRGKTDPVFHPAQRLFAVEYTNYRPIEYEKFLSHPAMFQSTHKGE